MMFEQCGNPLCPKQSTSCLRDPLGVIHFQFPDVSSLTWLFKATWLVSHPLSDSNSSNCYELPQIHNIHNTHITILEYEDIYETFLDNSILDHLGIDHRQIHHASYLGPSLRRRSEKPRNCNDRISGLAEVFCGNSGCFATAPEIVTFDKLCHIQ